MNYTFLYVIFLFFSLIYRYIKRSAAKTDGSRGVIYSKSIYNIQFLLYLVFFAGYAIEYFFCNREVNLIVSSMGFILYLSAIFTRELVIKSLGKYWSHYIEIKEDHKLIKQGLYNYVRHPHLLCLLVEMTGLALIPNSYYSLILTWVVYFPITLLRIHLEEKALIEKFGEEYLEYKREVYALLPLKKMKLIRKRGLI